MPRYIPERGGAVDAGEGGVGRGVVEEGAPADEGGGEAPG